MRQSKPIIMLKPGRTPDGAKASASHTGSLASDDAILDGALRQHGIARAEDEDEFLNALRALVMLPKPKGKRVGIATTSGALGVISTDLIVQNGLELALFEPATLATMRSILPDWLEPANPYDFWIGIDVKGPREAHEVGLRAVFADPNVDLVLCTLLAPGNADFPEFGALVKELRLTYDKPVAMVIYGGDAGRRWTADLDGANVPIFTNHPRSGARIGAPGAGKPVTIRPPATSQCGAGVDFRAVDDILLVGVVVDAGRQGRLRAVANRRHAEIAPTARIASRQADHEVRRSAAHRLRRGGQPLHQRIVERRPVRIPGLHDLDADIRDRPRTCRGYGVRIPAR